MLILFIVLTVVKDVPPSDNGERDEVAGHEKNRFNLFERVRRVRVDGI